MCCVVPKKKSTCLVLVSKRVLLFVFIAAEARRRIEQEKLEWKAEVEEK